jgi:hypothetical protein
MRLLPFPGLVLGIALSAVLAAGLVRAEDNGNPADQPATAEAPDPGAVAPEPYDASLARLNKGQCRKLARQIIQYTDVAARADDRGDELWEQSTVAHVDRLEARWNALCATEDDSFARMFNRALTVASRLALKYFTMGYFD